MSEAEKRRKDREKLLELYHAIEPAPAPAKKTKPRKEFDVGKARALRNAKWSYEKIGEELHCSAQTVINHLKAAEEAEQHG